MQVDLHICARQCSKIGRRCGMRFEIRSEGPATRSAILARQAANYGVEPTAATALFSKRVVNRGSKPRERSQGRAVQTPSAIEERIGNVRVDYAKLAAP